MFGFEAEITHRFNTFQKNKTKKKTYVHGFEAEDVDDQSCSRASLEKSPG